MDHRELIVWAFIAMIALLPFVLTGIAISTRRRQRRGDARPASAGGLLGLDEFFYPGAHEARALWDAEEVIPIPAPSPDRGPDLIAARNTDRD